MSSNTRYRIKIYADAEKRQLLEETTLILFCRNEAAVKHALSNAKELRTDRITSKVYQAYYQGTPYFSLFFDRQVFVEIFLPKVDYSMYLW